MSREAASSVADLGVGIIVRAAAAAIDEMAAGLDRTADEIVAKNLTTAARGATGAGGRDAARRSGSHAAGLRPLPCGTVIAVVTLGDCRLGSCRLGRFGGTLLLAFIVVIQQIAVAADDLGAFVAIGLEAAIADQRTDARLPGLHRVECIRARHLHVEFGAGIAV